MKALTIEQRNIRLLLDFQPEARRIRFAGKCPDCKQFRLWSYQLPHDRGRDPDEEDCGFYCGNCKWGNAGVRPVWTRKRGL